MKISVIIPCYNSYKNMSKCLNSLENQTFKDFEVIIVDDFSTDNTYSELTKYIVNSNLKIKLLKTDKNGGPGKARNIAITQATGEYISFCDSDDWYDFSFLDRMYRKAYQKNADIVMCNYKKIFNDEHIEIVNYTSVFSENETPKKYLAYSRDSLCLLLVKRSLLDKFNIPELYNGEDMATIPILLSQAKSISHVSEPLYNYFIRQNSLSNTVSSNIYTSLIQSFDYILNNIDNEKYAEEVEYLGIRNVLYGAILNGCKANVATSELNSTYRNFKTKFPKWERNQYLSELGIIKIVFIYCLKYSLWPVLKIMAKVQYWYTSKK